MSRAHRRWLIVAAGVLATTGVWALFRETGSIIRVAETIELGMTREQVSGIMTAWNPTRYDSGDQSGLLYGCRPRAIIEFVREILSIGVSPPVVFYDDWPVHIQFDESGHVDRIKRGDEIIEAQLNAQ